MAYRMPKSSIFSEGDTSEDLKVPEFKNEEEEADWWFKNQKKVGEALIKGANNGKLKIIPATGNKKAG